MNRYCRTAGLTLRVTTGSARWQSFVREAFAGQEQRDAHADLHVVIAESPEQFSRRGLDPLARGAWSDGYTVNHLLSRLSEASRGSVRQEPKASKRRIPDNVPRARNANGSFRAMGADLGEAEPVGIAPFGSVHFTNIRALRSHDEVTAGVVVVSSGKLLCRRLDDLDDVLNVARWPLLGVLDVMGKRPRSAQ